jgi:hypothetical protein
MEMGVGASALLEERRATVEAMQQARTRTAQPVFAVVFATDNYDPQALAAAINEELGAVPWAGCTTGGVFAQKRHLQRGIAVALLSGRVSVGVGVAEATSTDARRAGALATTGAVAKLPAPALGSSRALVVLSDALTGNVADVVRGALEIAGSGVVWAGGGAGGSPEAPYGTEFAHGRAYHDAVVVLAIDSPARMAAGISHGFRPCGPPVIVTRAHGAVAAELDYEVAFAVYQRTARARGIALERDDFATFATTHPLGIPRADGTHVIRDPLGVDNEGALRCFGEVPDGCLVRVMEGDRNALLAAAQNATSAAATGVDQPLAGALVFDCLSRPAMLGDGFKQELGIFNAIGDESPVMGCLTYGEIGALGGGVPQFHNKTAVVLALGA